MTSIIKSATTKELVAELINRGAARAISTGLFKDYELSRKYNGQRQTVECDQVLLLEKQTRNTD